MKKSAQDKGEDMAPFTLKIECPEDKGFMLMLSPQVQSGLALTAKRKATIREALELLTRFAEENDCVLKVQDVKQSAEVWEVPSWLKTQTYQVEHNPNCPSPFLVRMIGKGRGRIYQNARKALGLKAGDG